MRQLSDRFQREAARRSACVSRLVLFDPTGLQTGHSSLLRISGRIAIVALMLGLWLGLLGLSTSERLHQLVHSDAHAAHHECLVTFFSKNLLLYCSAEATVSATALGCVPIVLLAGRRFSSVADLRLESGRAPPLVSSFQ